jgi:hypothetical protein
VRVLCQGVHDRGSGMGDSGLMPPRFAHEELVALGRSPRERLAAALGAGDDAASVYDGLLRGFVGFLDGFRAWLAVLDEHLRAVHDDRALGAVDLPAAAVDDAVLRELLAGPDADAGAVLAAYDMVEAELRRRHDQGCDGIAAALGHVYRRYGVDALEQALRVAGDRTLVAWMPRDEARPFEVRVRHWARMLTGNFARVRLEEDADGVTIVQDPCGTCGGQVERRCMEPDGPLAVVRERHPLTFGLGDTPVYRTHVAVMHYLLPIERTGRVWPIIDCPPRGEAGPCRIRIPVDPDATPRAWNDRVRSPG